MFQSNLISKFWNVSLVTVSHLRQNKNLQATSIQFPHCELSNIFLRPVTNMTSRESDL